MSLLRKAERCFASQQANRLLNAWVAAPTDGAFLQRHAQALEAADERRIKGNESCLFDQKSMKTDSGCRT